MKSPTSDDAAPGEFRAGGRVLFAALIGVACGASPIPYNVLPVMIGPWNAEFGWGRFEIGLGVLVFGVIASLLAPVFGTLSDKYGVRRVALWSLVAFGIAFALFAFTPASLPGYYALWALVGLVGIGSTPVTFSRAIALWFRRSRGLALGIMLLGTSLAGLLVPQLARAAIEEVGWRAMFPLIALLPLAVALPIGLALFREPRPDERAAGLNDAAGKLTGLTLRQAMRGRRFWTLWASIACVALAYGGAHINMVQMVMLHGFNTAAAVNVLTVVALGIMTGRILIGLLVDRFWAPAVAAPALLLPLAACALLMGTTTPMPWLLLAGFLLGFAAGAESDIIAYLASRYFGMAQFGRIYGWLYMAFGLFSAFSPAVYGLVRDRTGSYDGMLLAAMGLFATGAALLLTLGRYPETATAVEPVATPSPAPA